MFESLRTVSDRQILTDTDSLVAQDRQITLRLLAHLHEIERRKLFLAQGYSSMYDYCRTRLRLSEGSSMRRIRTARCLARFPELHTLLESGEVNLMSVALISRVLRPGNATALINRIRGKSKREVEAIVAEYEPRTLVPRDSTRVIVVPVAAFADPETHVAVTGADAPATTRTGEVGRTFGFSTATGGGENAEGASNERRTVIQFAARDEFMYKVERVRALVSHQLPGATFEQLFELALDELISRRDPIERQARRVKRAGTSNESMRALTPSGKRYVPAATRDHVFARDGFRCAFIAPDGRRCSSTVHLQVDHVRPVARGGASTQENLRILCAQHNRLEAERLMGRCGPPARPLS